MVSLVEDDRVYHPLSETFSEPNSGKQEEKRNGYKIKTNVFRRKKKKKDKIAET